MTRRQLSLLSCVALVAVAAIGCQTPDMHAMMAPVERPAELDLLQSFVGQWKGTAEMKMAGSEETMKGIGENDAKWALDKWYVVEHFQHGTEDEPDAEKGMAVWTWCPKTKKYHAWMFMSGGTVAQATATYDADSGTWHMNSKSHNPYKKLTMKGKGTATLVGGKNWEWDWTEWTGGLFPQKVFEGTGTSHRQ